MEKGRKLILTGLSLFLISVILILFIVVIGFAQGKGKGMYVYGFLATICNVLKTLSIFSSIIGAIVLLIGLKRKGNSKYQSVVSGNAALHLCPNCKAQLSVDCTICPKCKTKIK